MKTQNAVLILGAAALAFYLWNKQGAAADTNPDRNNGGYGGVVDGGYTLPTPSGESKSNQTSDAQMQYYAQTVQEFNKTPSVQTGINVINAAAVGGIQLPRTSETIAKNVIINGVSGSIANIQTPEGKKTLFVSAKPAARDSSGQTNFDRIIAKNKALGGK